MKRRLLAIASVTIAMFVAPRAAWAEAFSPEEALQHFQLADGFEVSLVASEPLVRQPVTMTFDRRGRLWVIQYLQYPNPAGLTPVEVDRYLRTKYDRRPEPPPKGPRGADRITILEDTDGDGRMDQAKDFVTGLNLASALALGDGGVYVGAAPYLLFYADRDGDDLPDGDPEVLLTGFGLEDAHAVVNSMQYGPDGWLYGAQGSTVTADIRGIGFQQGIWRYHPPSKRFELFSEGGGNTWGLDFDRHGGVIAGTNWGDAVALHQVQGGYYVKGFSKHGPLHNPFTFGYFDHIKHTGYVGGHVTCGGIVYQGDAFPDSFRDCYIGPNLLSNEISWHRIEAHGSTYTTHHAGTLLKTDDIWFRPIDSLVGPDGALYVADWYDKRANHVIPVDDWDKTNGRVWRIAPRGAKRVEPIDLARRSSGELVDLLAHRNAWYPREARRILAERRDPAVLPRLEQLVDNSADKQLPLEALWTLYCAGGWNRNLALKWLDHPNPDVRAWTVRLLGDDGKLDPALAERLLRLAANEPCAAVRSQLAATAKRLPAADGLPIVERLLRRDEDAGDTHIPLLLWWAVEDKALSNRDRVLELLRDPTAWQRPLVRDTIIERLARRYLAEKSEVGYAACATLLAMAPTAGDVSRVVSGMEKESTTLAGRLPEVPPPLAKPLAALWHNAPHDAAITRLALRLGSHEALQAAIDRAGDPREPDPSRVAMIAALGQSGDATAQRTLLALVEQSKNGSEAIRLAALAALERFSDDLVALKILEQYSSFTPPLRQRALTLLAGRRKWSTALVEAVALGQVDAQEVTVEQLRQMLAHNDQALATAIEARWGKTRPATPGEKMAYVPVLGRVLNAGKGDLPRGHELFKKHCATCHTLFGEGNKIGPDLTTADRKNREALLLNILDPSGYVRPEFVAQTAVLNDGRVLTGLVVESTGSEITLVDAKNQRTTVAREAIEQIEPSQQSLMPERLLETLAEQEVRDLFSYLQSNGAATVSAGN